MEFWLSSDCWKDNISGTSFCRGSIKTVFSAPQFSEDIHPTQATHYQVDPERKCFRHKLAAVNALACSSSLASGCFSAIFAYLLFCLAC